MFRATLSLTVVSLLLAFAMGQEGCEFWFYPEENCGGTPYITAMDGSCHSMIKGGGSEFWFKLEINDKWEPHYYAYINSPSCRGPPDMDLNFAWERECFVDDPDMIIDGKPYFSEEWHCYN